MNPKSLPALRASRSIKSYSPATHRIHHPSQDTSSKRNAEPVDTRTAGVRWTILGKPGPIKTQPFGTGSHGCAQGEPSTLVLATE